MTEEELKEICENIQAANSSAIDAARKYQDTLAKPPQSLGVLEDIAIKLSGITGKIKNTIENRRIVVFAADNGVVLEGVSVTPQSVTLSQAINMTRYLTGMSSLAKHFGNQVEVVDVGIAANCPCDKVLNRKIAFGTKNLHKEPAMTKAQALKAIEIGMERAKKAKEDGIDILGCGEMGIGNTTTSSAVLAALTNLSVEEVTGRGGGLTDSAFENKKRIIKEALLLHKPDKNDVLDVLSKVGGFDIAAMCGFFLGAAKEKIPVVIDGFISIVAALCAYRLCPICVDYFFPSHGSFEIGYKTAAAEMGLKAFLQLSMRLGEGSGCPLAFEIIDAACAFTNEMATFEQAAINDDYLEEIRDKDSFTV